MYICIGKLSLEREVDQMLNDMMQKEGWTRSYVLSVLHSKFESEERHQEVEYVNDLIQKEAEKKEQESEFIPAGANTTTTTTKAEEVVTTNEPAVTATTTSSMKPSPTPQQKGGQETISSKSLGADPKRNNNAFMFGDDPRGLKSPVGSHVRRMNPRDSVVIGEARLHRMIRRGTNYGPPLPLGVLEDDGGDRGLIFAFVGAHLDRQFEFVQREWVNDGRFIGAPAEKDALVNSSDGREFTIPKQPIHRRLKGLPAFVVNRGGEYCFMPGLRALRWLADLDT